MNVLNVLQTIAMCISAAALVAIALILFMIVSSNVPLFPKRDDGDEEVAVTPLREAPVTEVQQPLDEPIDVMRTTTRRQRPSETEPPDASET
jgi:hypothetical protein